MARKDFRLGSPATRNRYPWVADPPGVTLSPVWSVVGLAMLAMTAGVAVDAHRRNKYATPWFAAVSLLGIFGVLFYYVTIRTEEIATEIPTPSRWTRGLLPMLAVAGAYLTALVLLQIGMSLDSTSTGGTDPALFWATLFPAVAIAVVLRYDFAWGGLPRSQLFAECLYAFVVGSVLVLTLFPEQFVTSVLPYHAATAAIVLLAVTFPIGWYRYRRRAGVSPDEP